MAYVPVPKDLTKVKTKVALNLTKRQLIFFSLAAVTGIPFYLLARKSIGSDVAAIFMVTIMLPFFFLAMYEKDGLPFEKIMGNSYGFSDCGEAFGRTGHCCGDRSEGEKGRLSGGERLPGKLVHRASGRACQCGGV
ncbi:MAG TPA: PrgI family protein [Lachnospiraceae bacterium]|nr:PrgI family protein [Lachnospiraceae bacterium]